MSKFKVTKGVPKDFRSFLSFGSNLREMLFKSGQPYRLPWYQKIVGRFIEPRKVQIDFDKGEYYSSWNSSITIDWSGVGIQIKCNTCTTKKQSFTLCDHQVEILRYKFDILALLTSGKVDSGYRAIRDNLDRTENLSRGISDKYYTLCFEGNGFHYESDVIQDKEGEYLGAFDNLLKNRSNDIKEKKQWLKESLETGRSFKPAMVWSEGYDDEVLIFATGLTLKTKRGLQKNKLKRHESPKGFSGDLRELVYTLYHTYLKPNSHERFDQLRTLVLDNLEAFNTIYHYIQEIDEYGRKEKMHLVEISTETVDAVFYVNDEEGMLSIRREVMIGGKPLVGYDIVCINDLFLATKDKIYFYCDYQYPLIETMYQDVGSDIVLIPKSRESQALLFLESLEERFSVVYESEIKSLERVYIDEASYEILLREVGKFITFEPRIVAGEYAFNVYEDDLQYLEGNTLYTVRQEDVDILAEFINNAHPNFNIIYEEMPIVYLPVADLMKKNWFIGFAESCDLLSIELKGQENLKMANYSKHRAEAYSHISSGIDWFDVDMGISFGGEKIRTADWIKALRNKESFVKLKDGTIGMLPQEWMEQAKKVLAVANVEKGDIRISKYRFNVIDDLFEELNDEQIRQEISEKRALLSELDTNRKYRIPKKIQAELRSYQKYGYSWMRMLEESGFGGILADDMGLGKTLQVISLLASQKKYHTSLVIVPRSLLFNWSAELDKFCPALNYVVHHGSTREKEISTLIKDTDIIITTYDTASRDIEILRNHTFNYIILDESQAIKNPNSQRYKAMRLLQADHRLAMTGTPIENNTFDLFAQLSFTSPGLLGSMSSFKDNFATAIDGDGDQDAADLLRKLIHPFVLRRTKDQVAKDLPERTETVIYCEMGKSQRKLYENLKRKIKEDLEEKIETEGLNRSKFLILDGLL